MTPEKLKGILSANGWRLAPQHEQTGVDWYAYRSLEAASDCTSNEKPPSLILKPWKIDMRDGTPWCSVEFDVTGEVGGDHWLSMKVYSVPMNDAIAAIPRATAILLFAWNAAASLDAPARDAGHNNGKAERLVQP